MSKDFDYGDPLLVLEGVFSGRICTSDDEEFLTTGDLSIKGAVTEPREKLEFVLEPADPNDPDDYDLWGVECEVITFGAYLECAGHFLVPRNFLRRANMSDLIRRSREISEVLGIPWFKKDVGEYNQDDMIDLLLERAYIFDSIWSMEKLVAGSASGQTVFLCHASADKPFVRQVANDLAAAGFNVWLDEFEIKVGESIVEKISKATAECDALILFVSEHSARSEWVKREWQSTLSRSLSGRGGRVLPALVEECEIPSIMSDVKYANFSNSYNEGLKAIIESM